MESPYSEMRRAITDVIKAYMIEAEKYTDDKDGVKFNLLMAKVEAVKDIAIKLGLRA